MKTNLNFHRSHRSPHSERNDPVLEEYSRLARDYDTRWSFYVEGTMRETMRRLQVHSGSRVLDVGCGTGRLLHRLAKEYPQARLCGVDPVPEMLAVARLRLPSSVNLVEGRAERLPLHDAQFDLVVCSNVFHFLHQPTVALDEMSRVLRPEGQLVITDWCHDYLTCRVCYWYLRLVKHTRFKLYGQKKYLQLLRQAGYVAPEIERFKVGWWWGLMTARARKETVGHESQGEANR